MELDEQPITMLDSSSWLGSKILNLKTGVRTTYRVPKILYSRQWLRCYCFRKLGTPPTIEDV